MVIDIQQEVGRQLPVKKLLNVEMPQRHIYAIYIRVSTEKQAIDGDSIETQEELGVNIIESNNGVLYRVYIEPAVSASKTKLKDRSVLMECLRDAKAGLFNKLIVYRRDRLSRKAEDSLAIRSMLESAKCGLIFSATGEMQAMLNDPYGKLMENIRASMDEIESATISVRVKDNMLSKAKRGEFTGGNIPYGYIRVEGETIQIPEEIELINEVEELYLSGHGIHAITKWLNGQEVSNLGVRPSGAAPRRKQHKRALEKWTKEVIKTILFSKFYMGISVTSKDGQRKLLKDKSNVIEAQAIHKPCRTPERQGMIDRVRQKKIDGTTPPRFFNTSFLLTGLLFCGECGRHYHSRNSTRAGGKQYSYYVCSSGASHTGDFCGNHSYKKEIIEEFVMLKIKKYLSVLNLENLTQEVMTELKSNDRSIENDLKEIAKKIERLTKDNNALKRMLLDLDEEDPNYELLRADYQMEQSGVLKRLSETKAVKIELESQADIQQDKDEALQQVMQRMKEFSSVIDRTPFHMQKSLIDEVVEKIVIDKNGQVNVEFKLNLASATSEQQTPTVDIDVINYGGVGEPTTSKNIKLKLNLNLQSGMKENYIQWVEDIYNRYKDGFKPWLINVTKKHYPGKLIPHQLHQHTGIGYYSARSYLNYGAVPSLETLDQIARTYDSSVEEMVSSIGVEVSPGIMFDIITQARAWHGAHKERMEYVN